MELSRDEWLALQKEVAESNAKIMAAAVADVLRHQFPGEETAAGVSAEEQQKQAQQEAEQARIRMRDGFAASALNGILGCSRDFNGGGDRHSNARLAYSYADAMLAAREPRG